MAVEHSLLTGSNLHESKGVAAATANKVYITDGAGSGTWSKVTADSLGTTVTNLLDGLTPSLLHIRDVKTLGTQGGTFTSGSWQTRTLNSVVTNEITGASLASNRFTLPAGKYMIEAIACAYQVNITKAKLYSITDSADVIMGTGEVTLATSGPTVWCKINGTFTIASSKVYEIQHKCQTTKTSAGYGEASGYGDEVYCEVIIWKMPA